MKILKLFLAQCILISSFSACVTITKSFNDKLFSIEKGMSKEQVLSILGKPDYRRFDNAFEKWEYNPTFSVNVMVVTFENGKVSALDSFAQKLPAQTQPQTSNNPPVILPPSGRRPIRVIGDAEFNSLYKLVKSKPFKDDQVGLIRDASVNTVFTCKQTKQLMNIFPFDDDKLKVIEFLSNNISDRENSYQLIDALAFLDSKDKARAFLQRR
ncbi:MAG: hypothetical protein H6Q14_749 [Bacteroidetes bacterium]|jgi:outer membrane protein assembly factor BamE (lipoprotein component of BamABCDE complex)|nr:hypothetical protein [Bacteroidota bacterium]